MRIQTIKQRGDTIIEVLIAMVVISSMFTSAFLLLRRTTTNACQSQERGEALKLMENQIERLRLVSDSIADSKTDIFCIDNSNVVQAAYSPNRARPMVAVDVDNFSQYTASCKRQIITGGVTYYVSIEPNTGKLYKFRVRWDKAGGGGSGKEEAVIVYRTPQVVTVVVPPPAPLPVAPTVTLNAPVIGATVSGATVTLTATAAAGSGTLTGIQFKVDGVNFGLPGLTSPYSLTWNSTSASNGTHTITAIATNSSGLSTTSVAATVTVNNVVPKTAGNLALNKPITASSVENDDWAGLGPNLANDGNTGTRWASKEWDGQWILVDMGVTYNIIRVAIDFEYCSARDFVVQLGNASTGPWTTFASYTNNPVDTDRVLTGSGNGRWLRVQLDWRACPWGFSIFELGAYEI